MKKDTLLKSIIVLIVSIMLPCSIGEMIRSFMDATTHTIHKMTKEGTIQWQFSSSTSTPPEAKLSSFSGVSTPLETPNQKPSIWQPGYCTGICNTEEELHTRIGHVLENPLLRHLDTRYARFHILNIIAKELCTDGIEHECRVNLIKATT